MDTAFKKGTAGLRDGNGLISLKAILKYKHGSLPQKNKLSRELAKQAVITKCRVKYQGGAKPCLYKIKPWISVPKKEKSVIIKISLIFKNLC